MFDLDRLAASLAAAHRHPGVDFSMMYEKSSNGTF